ncbi:MAG: hypothetical protein Q8O19_04130, partial [Rectinemataceae bacterium]|nr:hypothetical protein [Rectinemataceae bacterium]
MDIVFDEIKIYLPKTIEAITTARRLLDLVEEDIVDGWVCKHCGCTENMPCPDGCSWVAPNVCSRCAEENAPEIIESETSRGVFFPARESSLTTEKDLKCPDSLKKIAKIKSHENMTAITQRDISSHHGADEGEKHDDISQSSSTEQSREAKPPVTHSAKSKLGTP